MPLATLSSSTGRAISASQAEIPVIRRQLHPGRCSPNKDRLVLPAQPALPVRPGPPVSFQGVYSAAVTYAAGDAVFFTATGSSYISLHASNINHSPPTSPADWSVLAQGSTGPTGPTGLTGPTG